MGEADRLRNMTKQMDDEFDKMWRNLWIAIGAIFVGFMCLMIFVVGPSHDERREKCNAVGGVVIDGGVCVKSENVLRY